MIGYKDSEYIQKINVSIACWSLVCGVTVSLLVVKIRRRVMYMACTISLLLCYIAWTISMERAQTAADAGNPNNAANIAVLFFIYAYSPCYNMGYNALTYSKLCRSRPEVDKSPGQFLFPVRAKLTRNPPTSQPTWWKCGRTWSALAASPYSSSLAAWPDSSPPS